MREIEKSIDAFREMVRRIWSCGARFWQKLLTGN